MELTFQVVPGVCTGCGACLRTCPEHAVRPGPATTVGAGASAGPVAPGAPDVSASASAVPAALDAAAVSSVPGRAPVVLTYLCTGCGECMEVCPVDAIEEVVGGRRSTHLGVGDGSHGAPRTPEAIRDRR